MTTARAMPLLAALALAGCATATPAAFTPVESFNAEPLVTGSYPAGYFGITGDNVAFSTPNSLPPGAANMPVRNP